MTKLLIISMCFLCPLWLDSLRRSLSAVALAKVDVLVAKIPRNLRKLRLLKDLRLFMALYNCKETFTDVMNALQIKLFMQNKANFRKVKFHVTKVLTTDYDQMDTWSIRKTKPIQSQSKPIKAKFKAKFKKAEMNVTSYITKGYENKSNWAICENEPKTNPTCRGVASGEAGNKPNFASAQRPKKEVRCRISALGPLSSVHERYEKNPSPRLLIKPICRYRRGECIKQPPPLKQRNPNKEHCIASWKCKRKLIIDK
jgi:hypothetical protein